MHASIWKGCIGGHAFKYMHVLYCNPQLQILYLYTMCVFVSLVHLQRGMYTVVFLEEENARRECPREISLVHV